MTSKAGSDPYNLRKLSPSQQWMADHPNDKSCPKDPHSAAQWRRKRGLDAAGATLRAKYEAAMAETRAARAARGEDAEANDNGSVFVGRDPEWDALCEQYGRK
jgi:hypothetical protein